LHGVFKYLFVVPIDNGRFPPSLKIMTGDDQMVLGYLQKYPLAFVSPMEVCKRAGGKKCFAENPDWAKPILQRLALQRVLEVDALGHYRIRPTKEEEEEEDDFCPRPDAPISAEKNEALAPDDIPFSTPPNP